MKPTTNRQSQPVIAIVVGEASGDILGAGLIRSLKQLYPDARFVGIGGPLMLQEGFETLFPMERLSVMGLVEVLGRIFELIKIRSVLRDTIVKLNPEVFIGIDAPDFNLGLARQLKRHGLKTVHYVSPSVWAWRQNRVVGIAQSIDLMLALFPFEARFYEQHSIDVRCVGHPQADDIDIEPDQLSNQEKLGLNSDKTWITLMPGSRAGEVKRLGPVFIDAAIYMHKYDEQIEFLIPCVNLNRRAQIERLMAEQKNLPPITLLDGQSREAMSAADAVLLASGTAALEAMLLKRPMVVAYKVAALTFWIMKKLLKVPYVSLPNLLSGKEIVPELLQDAATGRRLGKAVLKQLSRQAEIQEVFRKRHLELRKDASSQSAQAIFDLINRDDLKSKP